MNFKKTVLIVGALAVAGPSYANIMVIGEGLGEACFNQAKYGNSDRNALSICDKAIENGMLNKKDIAATYVNRGIVRSSRGDLEGAVEDYNNALRINPTLGEAFANRGTVYIRKEQYTMALDELDRALSLDLEQPAMVYFNRAIVYEHFGDSTKAYNDYKMASELRPTWDSPQIELTRFTVISD